MKTAGIIALLAVSLCVLSSLPINICLLDKGEYIVTLDVCRESGTAVSCYSDTPVIAECTCKVSPLELAGIVESSGQHSGSAVTTFQLDRPPRS